jgi:hypothetical protein
MAAGAASAVSAVGQADKCTAAMKGIFDAAAMNYPHVS